LATVGETVLDHLPQVLAGQSTAKAAACVRTAALVNGPKALTMLAAYACDARRPVQIELIRAWKYFDPETYAREVLAEAPLVQDTGTQHEVVEVDFAAAVPHLHHLRHLRDCDVNLLNQGPVEAEVRALAELHQLRMLALLGDVVPDTVVGLGRLTNLEELFVDFATGWPTTLGFLANLTRLRNFVLTNAKEVADFSFLQGMGSLRMIGLSDSPVLAWIDEVQHPERVGQIWASGVENADTLRKVVTRFPQLRHLRLHHVHDIDLTPLQVPSLRQLFLFDCSNLDFGPLRDMPDLKWLYITGAGFKVDLSPLAGAVLTISLRQGVVPVGLDKLGPGVTVHQQKA
jgi:hypothetical protein